MSPRSRLRPRTVWAAILAGVVTLSVAGLLPGPAAAAAAGCHHVSEQPSHRGDIAQARAAVLCLVNRERAKRGLRKLHTNGTLTTVAKRLARDMVHRKYFDHTTPGGKDFSDRLAAAHWHGSSAGENIAWGSGDFNTPTSIVSGWMHSPGHRANILNRDFTRAGTWVALGAPRRGVRGGGTYAMDYDRP